MEFADVVVDDFNDFAEFSKEEEITNFIDEAEDESGNHKDVATLPEKISVDENVATSSEQKQKETIVDPEEFF